MADLNVLAHAVNRDEPIPFEMLSNYTYHFTFCFYPQQNWDSGVRDTVGCHLYPRYSQGAYRAEGDTRFNFDRLADFKMGQIYPELARLRKLAPGWSDVKRFPNMQVLPYLWEE